MEVGTEVSILLVLDIQRKIAFKLVILDVGDEVLAGYDCSAYAETAAGKTLRRGLHDDVRSVADRAQ